ncbi:uncharacterized protein LOC141648725 [Silene latifolia]|uniref:uncharacterized protein LOC141648725 n=1 Tax=Silene latifolia TaxID=37657 RepID=UPI003D775B17
MRLQRMCTGREKERRVREKLEWYHGLEVDSLGRSGGLAFLWRKEVDCMFVSASLHYMDFTVREGDREWIVTSFYGWLAVSDRHLSWELLRVLKSQSVLPWVCLGDFNEILYSTEMKGGSRAQWQINNFQAAVDECGLRDIRWEGYQFTFDNGQAGADNRQREEGCEEAVVLGVEKGRGDLVATLRECARELQGRKKVRIGKIKRSIELKHKALVRLNAGGRTETEVQKRKKIVAEIMALCRQEEQYCRQRSRALWLKDGDRNTKFFHNKAGERKRKNFIGRLIDDEGVERVGDEAIVKVGNEYFMQLFTSSNPNNFEEVL